MEPRAPFPKLCSNRLLTDLVFAGFAAGAAVVKSVFPQADIKLSLAEDAILLALTPLFNLLALAATGFGLGCHSETLTLSGEAGNVPLVTAKLWP